MIDIDPTLVLNKDAFILIDEWQTEFILWDVVRSEVDKKGISGQFIFTGSAVPQDDRIMHTGTGRITRGKM